MDVTTYDSKDHVAQAEYTTWMPSFPRIVADSCNFNRPIIIPQNANRPDFLNKSELEKVLSENNIETWSYEKRRTAQFILPFLYLGPMSVLKNHAWLQNEGITAVLLILNRQHIPNSSLPAALLRIPSNLELQTLVLETTSDQGFISVLPEYTHRVTHLLQSRKEGKVLVCCESGNERSASFVVAYLMQFLQLDLTSAVTAVRYKRFSIHLDNNAYTVLKTYEDILNAQVQVQTSSELSTDTNISNQLSANQSDRLGIQPRKRTFESDITDDVDDEMGNTTQSGKREFSPFIA